MLQAITSHNLKITLAESLVAAAAATISVLALGVPVWAMFIGWIAFFSRGLTARHGAINLVCVLGGLALGIAAAIALKALTAVLGSFAITAVVFVVAVLVLSLRFMPLFNNLIGYFLGLVSYFAAHLPPSFETFFHLGIAAALGIMAGLLAVALQKALCNSVSTNH